MGAADHRRRADLLEAQRTTTVVPLFAPTAEHNLPTYSSSFVGRGGEVAELLELMRTNRLVTLTGSGGIGKTRTALEVGGLARATKPDGVWMVELASIHDGALVEEAVRAAVPSHGHRDRGYSDLVDAIGRQNLLLILDNCEHLVAPCAELARRLLEGCPDLTILVTSREPLGLGGEQVRPLAPLPLPGPGDVDSVALGSTDAVRLFVERARAAVGAFTLNAEVAPAVADICRRLDGVPLAIELAAARLRVLSPAEIAARLDDRFKLLIGRRWGDPRHRTLRAAIQWSYDMLSPVEAALLRRLSVFAGGCVLPAAEAVCHGGEIERGSVLDVLDALAGKSLVAVESGRPVTRYRMLESIRHLALEKLEASGEAEDLRRSHAAWCVARAERAERERRGQRYQAWLMALEEDHDNFRSALTWARQTQQVDIVLALGGALTWFWETRGHLREGLEWLMWAVANDERPDEERRAKALRGAGMLSWLLGDVSSAVPLVEESVNLFRKAGNEEEAEGCVCSNAFRLCSNPRSSLPTLQSNVARIRTTENFDRLAHSLVNCGMAHFFMGQAMAARKCFDECLALPLRSLEPETVGAALLGLGRVAMLVGDLKAAEAPFREALDLALHTGDHDGRSTAMSWMADLARARGECSQARNLLADAMELVAQRGPALSVARCRQFMGRVELAEGHLPAARAHFAASIAEPGAADMPYHLVRSLLGLGEVALAEGELDEAELRFEEVVSLASENGDSQAMASGWADSASLARARSDVEIAAKLAHRALEERERIGDLAGIVESLEQLGGIAAEAGRDVLAGRLFGAAGAARQGWGWARPAVQDKLVRREMRLVGTRLGRDQLEQLRTQGAALSPAEAVSYADRGWGAKAGATSGWESLTRTELAVLHWLADGLTNAEIGERLFISGRTVGTHLAHVYRKVGTSSRREVIRQAKDRDL